MPSQKVTLTASIKAAPEQVFDFLADHESFGRIWNGTTTRVREGDSEPNGVGSVRRVQVGPISFDETTTVHRRPELIEYRVTRGSPIKNHLGHIEIHPAGNGSRIHYTIEFDPRIPLTGCLIARQISNDWARGIPPIIREMEQAAASR